MSSPPDINTLLLRVIEIGISLTGEQCLERLLGNIVTEARGFCNAEAGTLFLKEGDILNFTIAQNDALSSPVKSHDSDKTEPKSSPPSIKTSKIPLSKNSLAGYVGLTGEILNIPDVYKIPPFMPYSFSPNFDLENHYRSKSMLLVPMKDPKKGVIGVLGLINARSKDSGKHIPFDPCFERLLLALASQAAVAVRNAQLTEELKKAYRDTVITLSVAADYRDTETAAHVQRVSHYCHIIAQELGLPEAECELLLFASPMHDIGKIGIPDAILQKPGKLTDEEYEEIKKHTLYGERILSNCDAEVLKVSRQIALTHHEKWDGTGYPKGLKGQQIPLYGRIAALADVFDALSSTRCYKQAFDIDEVLNIIDQDAGSHFDPTVVAAFKQGLPRILKIQAKFSD